MFFQHPILDWESQSAATVARMTAYGLMASSGLSLVATLPGLWQAWFGGSWLLPAFIASGWWPVNDYAQWIACANGAAVLAFRVLNPVFRWLPAREPAVRFATLATAFWILWLLALYFPPMQVVCFIRS